MNIYTFTGSYSLFSKRAVAATKELVDASTSNKVRFIITSPLTPFFKEDKMAIELKALLYSELGRFPFTRKQVEILEMAPPSQLNGVNFAEGFWEYFRPNEKDLVPIAEKFMAAEDTYFCPYVYKTMDRSIFLQWAMTTAFGTLTTQVNDIDVTQLMTWDDFSEDEKENWTKCSYCADTEEECPLCHGTLIDVGAKGYDGPGLDVLLGQAKIAKIAKIAADTPPRP